MALSEYERRVLEEIESELTSVAQRRRWWRIRLAVRQFAGALLVLLLGIGACVVIGLWAPTVVATVVAAVVGFAVGLVWARNLRRRRGP